MAYVTEAIDQEKVANKSPLQEMGSLGSDVVASVIELGELQWVLLIEDSKAALRQSVRSMITLMMSAIACLASIPVITLGCAHGLNAWLAWPLWACYLTVGFTFLVVGGLAAGFAVTHAATSLNCFHRSAHELSNNLRWLKSILRGTHSAN